MKKFISIVLVMILMFLTWGCDRSEEKVIKVLLPSGTPLIAIGDLLDDEGFQFDIVNGQDPLSVAFTKNEYDIIIAPLNLGAKLYIKSSSNYKLVSSITTNNTYIISHNDFTIDDLNNKSIMTYGTGSTPWIALKAALSTSNLEGKVNLITQTSAADVSGFFISNSSEAEFFLSAEPNISVIESKNKEVFILDVSEILKDDINVLIQACLFVNPLSDISDEVLNKIEKNIDYLNEKPKEYAQSIVQKNAFFTTLSEDVIYKCIPRCNINYLKAKDNMDIFDKYYNLLNKYNNAILGGTVPNEEFYYQ